MKLLVKATNGKALEKYHKELELYEEQQKRFEENEVYKFTEKPLVKPEYPDNETVMVSINVDKSLIIGYETFKEMDEVYILMDISKCYTDYYICKYNDKLIEELDRLLD